MCVIDNNRIPLSPHSGQREKASLCTICTGEFVGSI